MLERIFDKAKDKNVGMYVAYAMPNVNDSTLRHLLGKDWGLSPGKRLTVNDIPEVLDAIQHGRFMIVAWETIPAIGASRSFLTTVDITVDYDLLGNPTGAAIYAFDPFNGDASMSSKWEYLFETVNTVAASLEGDE